VAQFSTFCSPAHPKGPSRILDHSVPLIRCWQAVHLKSLNERERVDTIMQ
jgi:hypothetical protein